MGLCPGVSLFRRVATAGLGITDMVTGITAAMAIITAIASIAGIIFMAPAEIFTILTAVIPTMNNGIMKIIRIATAAEAISAKAADITGIDLPMVGDLGTAAIRTGFRRTRPESLN